MVLLTDVSFNAATTALMTEDNTTQKIQGNRKEHEGLRIWL